MHSLLLIALFLHFATCSGEQYSAANTNWKEWHSLIKQPQKPTDLDIRVFCEKEIKENERLLEEKKWGNGKRKKGRKKKQNAGRKKEGRKEGRKDGRNNGRK